MSAEFCACQTEHLQPAEHFAAKGKIHIFLVLNLGAFMAVENQEDFERLRGGSAFNRVFRSLKPGHPFIEDEDENETIKRGREFSVFRGHLANDWLYPTFLLDKGLAAPPSDPILREAWEKLEFRIRLSRTGILEIKLTWPIPAATSSNSGERLIDILRALLQIGARDAAIRPVQWELGLYGAHLFLKALPSSVFIGEVDKQVTLRLQPKILDAKELPPRLRYTILILDTILCRNCGQRIEARTFWTRDRKIMSAVLEGALIYTREGQFTFPELDKEALRKFEDLATWEDELCVFTPERCLIYYPPEHIFLPGQEGTVGPVKYEAYWKCIVRGIEHTINVRSAFQLLESYTTSILDTVPYLTKKVTDGSITFDDQRYVMHMADEIANTFNILPGLRNVLVPTNAFRASYAVNKFLYLNEVLRLKDVEAHIQRNVDELVIFLNHFANAQLQAELQQGESAINKIGIVVAMISMLVAGPSFLQDFNEFFGKRFGWSTELSFEVFVIMSLVMGMIIFGIYVRFIYRLYQRSKLRHKRLAKITFQKIQDNL
jgi:hypothetical protein